ncbi:MAG: TRAM domain-containing protein [Conexivisphaerales archaeon]
MKEIIVEFQKIVPEGKSLGKFNGKVVFAYGILPYEKARVRIIKEKKNYLEAELCENQKRRFS